MNDDRQPSPGGWQQALVAAVVYLAAAAVAGWWYLPDPLSPLVHGGDTNQFEYASYHFVEHLRFTPWPQLQLQSDAVLFPYGVKHVFETWAFEQNYLVGLFWQMLGPGPWIKWHWLAGLFVGAWGTFLLTRTRVEFVQALTLGFLASFANFYLFLKYPDHICYAACHWATLSVIVDHLLVRGILVAGRLSATLLALRALLTVLCLGHDLAYTAGSSLTSLTLHLAWLLVYGLIRLPASVGARARLRAGWSAIWAEVSARRHALVGLAAATLMAAFFLVPVAAQLAVETSNFPHPADQEVLAGMAQITIARTSPGRLLLPFLPGWNPSEPYFEIDDAPEQYGIGTVGWIFLALGILGLVHDWRRLAAYFPLLLLLVVFATYSPSFAWLRTLPWMEFSRVCGRSSCLYPAIFICFSLGWVWHRPHGFKQDLVAVSLALLLGIELIVGHQVSDDLSRRPTVGDDFWKFMRVVRETPGAGVLEFPFSATGGSGSFDTLNAFFETNSTTSTYRRFHGKNCPGHYFGRFLPTQARPLLAAGWNYVFMPEGRGILEPTRQSRSFDDEQWRFFSKFFDRNDFCGLILYLDRLAPGDEAEFYRRFGRPTAECRTAWNGRMAFIPKSEGRRARADRAQGLRVMLRHAAVYEYNGSWALADGDPHQAIRWFEQALELEPQRATTLVGLSEAYRALGDILRSDEYWRRARAASQTTNVD